MDLREFNGMPTQQLMRIQSYINNILKERSEQDKKALLKEMLFR